MWTDITISIFWENNYDQDISAVFDLFYDLELEFSRFLPNSSLSLLNQNRSLWVSDMFIDVLKKCKDIYHETAWYFNPLINLSQIWYSKSFDLQEFKQENIKVNLNFEDVHIDGNTVSLDTDQILDLGWIVKWYAVDLAKKYLDTKWYKNYIIDAGGDIWVAGITDLGKNIVVGIDDPFIAGYLFATLELKDKSIATSGNYKRKWTIEFKEYNHIINPITSSNNNEIISISLIADACYIADAYATACIAMWVDKALVFLKEHNIDAVIICSDQRNYVTEWLDNHNITIL